MKTSLWLLRNSIKWRWKAFVKHVKITYIAASLIADGTRKKQIPLPEDVFHKLKRVLNDQNWNAQRRLGFESTLQRRTYTLAGIEFIPEAITVLKVPDRFGIVVSPERGMWDLRYDGCEVATSTSQEHLLGIAIYLQTLQGMPFIPIGVPAGVPRGFRDARRS